MKVKWLGHSSFLITSAGGVSIITDPYKPDSRLSYGEIKETADIVTVSHEHGDHNNTAAVAGNPEALRASAEVKGIKFRGIPVYHDENEGKERGKNTIFCFTVDGVSVCHLGDLGHDLSESQLRDIGSVDILLMPVGGFYTIDADTAGRIGERLKPRVIIPMHFRNSKCAFPISGVEDFLRGKQVTQTKNSEAEFTADNLPPATQIMVLQPAL